MKESHPKRSIPGFTSKHKLIKTIRNWEMYFLPPLHQHENLQDLKLSTSSSSNNLDLFTDKWSSLLFLTHILSAYWIESDVLIAWSVRNVGSFIESCCVSLFNVWPQGCEQVVILLESFPQSFSLLTGFLTFPVWDVSSAVKTLQVFYTPFLRVSIVMGVL